MTATTIRIEAEVREMQKQWHAYPKILNFGHKFLEGLLDGPVVIQEKIDGSQVSWGVVGGELFFRSKRVEIYPENAGQFQEFVASVLSMLTAYPAGSEDTLSDAYQRRPAEVFPEGWVFRGEYLQRPKHNTIAYDRLPQGHIVLFDIERAPQDFVDPDILMEWASELGVDCAPLLFDGEITSHSFLDSIVTDAREGRVGSLLSDRPLDQDPLPAEGIVIKNYNKLGADGKIMVAKVVRSDFAEQNEKANKKLTQSEVTDQILNNYNLEAVWEKAVQRRRDDGEFLNSPQDIGPMLRDVNIDFVAEHEEDIKDALFQHYRKQLLRGVTRGFAEWFKDGIAASRWDD